MTTVDFPLLSTFAAERHATMDLLLAKGKGILAADEALHEGLIPRFAQFGVGTCTEESRRAYRSMMFGTPQLENYIAGIIFHEETLKQANNDGVNLADLTRSKGILVGAKTDRGLVPLIGGVDGELATEGLDGYYERALKLKADGVRFVKWRCVYRIQNGSVSDKLIEHNTVTQARYALISQAAGLVPIVEPEVMIDGDHSLATSAEVSEKVWSSVIRGLIFFGVELETIVLKPNMCVQGLRFPGGKATPEEVAQATVRALRRTVPSAVRMVAFLSGGLGDLESTHYLQAMAALGTAELPLPWKLSCSFARAAQNPSLEAWKGKDANVDAGRRALLHRVRMNSLASQNKYSEKDEEQK